MGFPPAQSQKNLFDAGMRAAAFMLNDIDAERARGKKLSVSLRRYLTSVTGMFAE
jgi:hypothetical protein